MPLRDNDPPLRRPADPERVQPGEPRPADDLRIKPFTDDHFSEYRARRKDKSGSPLGLVAGLVIGLAAVGGIGWYMYSSGRLMPTASDEAPQLVKADPDPYKVKPENPGGLKVENQDKLVYDRVAKGEAPPRVENLLPEPEVPKAPPRPAAPAPTDAQPAADQGKPDPVAVASAATEAAKPEPAAPEPEAATPDTGKPPQEAAKAAPAAAAKPDPPAPQQDDLAALVAAATGGREAATGPIAIKPGASPPAPPAPAQAPSDPAAQLAAAPPIVVPPIAAPPPAPPAALDGAFQIQLASARSEQGAMGEWSRIMGKNKDALAGLTPTVARVDLAEKGVFYRLRAGPLADKAAADSLCAALGAQNVGCIVVRP